MSCNVKERTGCHRDRNTRYFHTATMSKRARNRLCSIQVENGVVRRGDTDIADVATKYFQNLYESNPVSDEKYLEIFEDFQKSVSNEINADLTKEVTLEEIKDSVFAAGPYRAQCPDGFTRDF